MKSILRRLMTALFGFSLVVYILHYSVRGDTVALLKQVDHLIACVAHGQWSGWGGHFPLLQKLPAIAFRLLGWKDDQILEGLVALNLLSFVLMLMCSWRLLCSRSRRVAIFFSAVLCSGPLLWYAHVTFGESFAAFATLAFTVACLQKARGWKIALLLVFAGISKDVATPFLLFLGGTALCLNLQPSGGFTLAPSWRQIRPLAMGAALALATNGLKEWYRGLLKKKGFSEIDIQSVTIEFVFPPQRTDDYWCACRCRLVSSLGKEFVRIVNSLGKELVDNQSSTS